jgi:hypothetical protein
MVIWCCWFSLEDVLDLSDFDLSGSSFWSASHFCLLLHWASVVSRS